MIPIVVAVVVVTALWFVFSPGGPDKAEEMYQGIRGSLKFRRDRRELAKQLKRWVATAQAERRAELYDSLPAATEGLAGWLSALPEKELEAFTRGVARFCASLHFDIAWLTDPQIQREPELKKTVEDAVLLYSIAAWRATKVQVDVRAFLAYQAWAAKPAKHKKYGHALHSALVQRGLLTVAPDLYLAPEDQRMQQAARAIKRAADENPVAFREVLRQIDASRPVASKAPSAAARPGPTVHVTPPAAPPTVEPAAATPAAPSAPAAELQAT